MKERFLQYIWRYKLFDSSKLSTTDNQSIQIKKFGDYNTNAGPDFLNAQIRIASILWAGKIEIHVKSSDWEQHQHSKDVVYENLILHVVYLHNKEIPFLKERNIPTLELRQYISKETIFRYKELLQDENRFIPCEKLFSEVEGLVKENWLERMMMNRLEEKSNQILEMYKISNLNWEEVLFKRMSYTFGLKVNAISFEVWANSFEFKILQRNQQDIIKLTALFLGQAGFLEEEATNQYVELLREEYSFLKGKYKLEAVDKGMFYFFRLRPANFPTIRLAQLAAVYAEVEFLFSLCKEFKNMKELYTFFGKITLNPFWNQHFTLNQLSKEKGVKKITTNQIDLIALNVLLPIRYAYEKYLGESNEEFIFKILSEIRPEKNEIVNSFRRIGANIKNAMHSQAYLEMKKEYCDEKKCLNCTVGYKILKNA